jgi:hypothetical protein
MPLSGPHTQSLHEGEYTSLRRCQEAEFEMLQTQRKVFEGKGNAIVGSIDRLGGARRMSFCNILRAPYSI